MNFGAKTTEDYLMLSAGLTRAWDTNHSFSSPSFCCRVEILEHKLGGLSDVGTSHTKEMSDEALPHLHQ